MATLGVHIANEDWFKLPLGLRKRWWTETDYGKLEPSEDLKRAVHDFLEKPPDPPPRPEPSVPFKKG
jgi:hypothetical protein